MFRRMFTAVATIILCSLIVASAQAAVTVQISTVRDVGGKWTTWTDQAVTEETVASMPGDHTCIDNDAQQDWWVPNKVGGVTKDYFHLTFDMPETFEGEYAIRVSFSAGARWTDLETCSVEHAESEVQLTHSDG